MSIHRPRATSAVMTNTASTSSAFLALPDEEISFPRALLSPKDSEFLLEELALETDEDGASLGQSSAAFFVDVSDEKTHEKTKADFSKSVPPALSSVALSKELSRSHLKPVEDAKRFQIEEDWAAKQVFFVFLLIRFLELNVFASSGAFFQTLA